MDQPRSGFPMYIAMHGGGSNGDLAKANRAWRDVAVPGGFFRGPVAAHHKVPNESAVLVCVRGVSSFDKEKKRERLTTGICTADPSPACCWRQ